MYRRSRRPRWSTRSDNPLENDVVMATVARYLGVAGRRLLRSVALLVPRGKESVAQGAVPGCFILGSVARRAANEAEECAMVSPCYRERRSCACSLVSGGGLFSIAVLPF